MLGYEPGIGTTLIGGAAVAGSFSSRSPVWLDALFAGWVLGYLMAFDALSVGWWRQDPEFRERVRALRAR
jgi:hypothetical protein